MYLKMKAKKIKKTRIENDLTRSYPTGSYIRKGTFDIFRGTNRVTERVNTCFFIVETNELVINHSHFKESDGGKFPVVVTKEESDFLNKSWEVIQINVKEENIKESLSKEFEHFREDNGQPKNPLSIKRAKIVLFKFQTLNPEGKYNLYRCSVCNEIHIGKTKDLIIQ